MSKKQEPEMPKFPAEIYVATPSAFGMEHYWDNVKYFRDGDVIGVYRLVEVKKKNSCHWLETP